MLNVVNITVHSFELEYLDVFWEIEDTYEDIDAYEMYVLRSEAQEGPYQILAGPFENKNHFRDTTVMLHRKYRDWWYRLRLVEKADTTNVKEFPDVGGETMAARPALHALEVARQNRLRLMEFSGRRMVFFPLRTSGQRCKCFDPITDQVVHDPCPTCFGTRRVGGFYTPIVMPAKLIKPGQLTRATRIGETKPRNTMLEIADFPLVKTGWIVIEPKENRRWRVGEQIDRIEVLRHIVRQFLPVHEIPKGDVSYKIPVNIDDPANFEPSPPRQFTNPHNLDSVDNDVYIQAMRAFLD